MRANQSRIDAAQADGLDVELPADRQDARVDQAVEHHGGHVDRFLVRDAPAVDHARVQPQGRLQAIQLRAAAVHQHGLDADLVQDGDLLDQVRASRPRR